MREPRMPSLTSQEKPPEEAVNFKVGEKEYDLEITKSDFEYPKYIQEESGILGYTRQKIDVSKIFELVNDALVEKGINLSEIGIANVEDWGKETREKLVYKLGEDARMLFYRARRVADDFCNAVLSKLSHGEYPMTTLNHQLSG